MYQSEWSHPHREYNSMMILVVLGGLKLLLLDFSCRKLSSTYILSWSSSSKVINFRVKTWFFSNWESQPICVAWNRGGQEKNFLSGMKKNFPIWERKLSWVAKKKRKKRKAFFLFQKSNGRKGKFFFSKKRKKTFFSLGFSYSIFSSSLRANIPGCFSDSDRENMVTNFWI